MRLGWGRSILTAAAAVVFAFSTVSGQQTEEGKRKVKSKTNPVLSEVARRMSIAGKVKLEVTIAPDGHVKSVRALGGHPLLVQSCVECVKEWKYETAAEESIQIVEFDFKQS
jgi:outer membrane biosynthesis protein TonB